MNRCDKCGNDIDYYAGPCQATQGGRVDASYNSKQQAFPASSIQAGGLTKREYMALEITKGLVAGWAVDIGLRRTDATFTDQGVRIADALLAELEK